MSPRPFTIVVSGKGGTGKTTLSSLLVRSFIDIGERPVLAVDADPNANLHEALGVKVSEALGSMREEAFTCLLYTSPSPRDGLLSRMPSSA